MIGAAESTIARPNIKTPSPLRRLVLLIISGRPNPNPTTRPPLKYFGIGVCLPPRLDWKYNGSYYLLERVQS